MKVRLGNMEIGLARYLGLWTVVVVLFATQNFVTDALDGQVWTAWDYLRWAGIRWYTWAALAPLVFRLAQRYPVRAPLRLHGLGAQLLASVAMTMLALVIGAFVSVAFEPSGFGTQLGYFVGFHAATGLLTYWALYAIERAMQLYQEKTRRELEASQLASELAQSRLQVLRAQLQPHFLFNTLHAIATLLDEDPAAAESMLLRLSELLRAFLEGSDGQEISLRRELELLELYLGIQRTRFRDRLSTRIYVAPDTLDGAVPALILQPLVENAIRHGIGQRLGSDCVEVESRREDGVLCIEVRNHNGRLEPEAGAGHGIGLSNTRLRLRELYGEAGQVRLDMIWPQGVVCRLRLPYREIEDRRDAPEMVSA